MANRQLHIDIEAVATLSMVSLGLLKPVTNLMGSKEARTVDETGSYRGKTFPFSFVLAPSGKRNFQVLSTAHKGEVLDLVCDDGKKGELTVDEVFDIDPKKRVERIYGTIDSSHPGVSNTLKRLGKLAVSGKYSVEFEDVSEAMRKVRETIKETGAQHVTGMVMAARPLHRAHERVIRQSLEETDLLVIFLSKPYLKDDLLPFSLRYEALLYYVRNFLPSHRVVIVPLENTYIFAGNNEMLLNALVVRNFGCHRFLVGRNHAGLGLYYEREVGHTIFERARGIDLEFKTVSEFVYCDQCKTLVTVNTCPHGQHHHISYRSDSILELLENGILPPAVLMRKEISAMLLAAMFPERFKNIPRLYYDLIPSGGLIEEHTQKDFYIALMKLYQTSSLT